jgi:hypothetical protein
LRRVLGGRYLFLFDLLLFVYLLIPLDIRLKRCLKLGLDVKQLFLLIRTRVKQRDNSLIVESQLKQTKCLSLVGYEINDVVFALIHFFLIVLSQSCIKHEIVV